MWTTESTLMLIFVLIVALQENLWSGHNESRSSSYGYVLHKSELYFDSSVRGESVEYHGYN